MSEKEKHDFKSISGHMARGAVWMVLMRWSIRFIGLFSTIILARLLTPDDFGVVAMAMVVVALIERLAETQVDTALLRGNYTEREYYDSAWTLQIAVGLCMTAVILLVSPFVASYFNDPRVGDILPIVATRAAIVGFQNIGIVDFRRHLQFGKEFRFWVSRKLATFVLVMIAALILRNYIALALAMPISAIVTVVISFWMSDYRPRLALAKIGEIWSISQWLLVFSVARYVNEKMDSFLVGGAGGSAQMGYYTVAVDIATMPSRELVLPTGRALLPTFAKITHDPQELARAFNTVLGFLGIVSLSAGVGMAVIAQDLVAVVLGSQWGAAVPYFRWLAIFGAVSGIAVGLQPFFIAIGRERAYALITLVQAALLIPALLAAYTWFGFQEIAAARAAVMPVILFYMLALVVRYTHVRSTDILAALWRPTLAAAGMGLVVTALHLPAGSVPVAVSLVFDIATGAVSFAAILTGLWMLSGRPEGAEKVVLGNLRPYARALWRRIG